MTCPCQKSENFHTLARSLFPVLRDPVQVGVPARRATPSHPPPPPVLHGGVSGALRCHAPDGGSGAAGPGEAGASFSLSFQTFGGWPCSSFNWFWKCFSKSTGGVGSKKPTTRSSEGQPKPPALSDLASFMQVPLYLAPIGAII